ncbi:hypothetical protein LZ32DRAFT_682185 [Colletotrichum eremochloae]|nr:hypothetical protein LZ32DRAFT_682185 [Colletotrichum eremochloae]
MIFLNLSLLLSCCLIFSSVASSHLLPRPGDDPGGHAWIAHNEVIAFPQNASSGFDGELELKFNPNLSLRGGCDIYPAVDANGNLGGGLRPTGPRRGGCDDGGKGQVYARLGSSHNRIGIMYSYYVPKVRWGKRNDEGHRHYWASIVVWIDHKGNDARNLTQFGPVGIAFTADHTTWKAGSVFLTQWGPAIPWMWIQNNAIVPYLPGDDASKSFGRTLVGWGSIPAAAQKALSDVKYEYTEVPFTDANFQKNMDAAFPEGVY